MTSSRIDVLRTRVARGLHASPRKSARESHMLSESTMARVEARITGTITRFLGGGARKIIRSKRFSLSPGGGREIPPPSAP